MYNLRSETDQYEGLTVNPSQIQNPVLTENNPARQNQGTRSQEIGYPVDPSTLGIDMSLQPRYFSKVHGSFIEDANSTNTDAYDSLEEGYSHDPGSFRNHGPSSPSASAPRYAPESRNIESSTAYNLAHNLAPPSESSRRCQICDRVFSNPDNRRRHMRAQHMEKFSYKCLLKKDGLACTSTITDRRNRRKHVNEVHPRESTELPPKSANRRFNDKTDEMLNRWFTQSPQSRAQ